jgi:KDO2-lipid IV(A) lauroyltransferase
VLDRRRPLLASSTSELPICAKELGVNRARAAEPCRSCSGFSRAGAGVLPGWVSGFLGRGPGSTPRPRDQPGSIPTGPRTVERAARAVFEEIGRNAYDFLRYPGLSPDRRRALVDMEGEQHLDGALASRRGAVVVTAHLGAWEVLAGALVSRGYPLKALAQPLREPRLEKLLRRHRERMGIDTFSSLDSPFAALRHVQQGGFLGVLMDQRMKREASSCFLGQATRMTDAPARSPGREGPGAGGDRRGRITGTGCRCSPPSKQPRLPRPFSPRPWPTRWVASSRNPEQWMWVHPRWTPAAAVEPAPPPDLGEEARAARADREVLVGCADGRLRAGRKVELEREIRVPTLETQGAFVVGTSLSTAWKITGTHCASRTWKWSSSARGKEDSRLTARGIVEESTGLMTARRTCDSSPCGGHHSPPMNQLPEGRGLDSRPGLVRLAKPDQCSPDRFRVETGPHPTRFVAVSTSLSSTTTCRRS